MGTAALTAALAVSAAPRANGDIYTRRNPNGTIEATNFPNAGGFRLTYPGTPALTTFPSGKLHPSDNPRFNHHIDAAARLHGVSVDLVRAIIQLESGFNHLATSTKGAKGLMQLMPSTAREMGVSNVFDPRQNIFAGVRYLRLMLDTFHGNVTLAAAAYNAGPNAVRRYGGVPPYRETQDYVGRVQSLLGLRHQIMTPQPPPQATFIVPSEPHTLTTRAAVPPSVRRSR